MPDDTLQARDVHDGADGWRLRRMEADVADLLRNVHTLSERFADVQLKMADSYVSASRYEREHAEFQKAYNQDLASIHQDIDGLNRKLLGLLLTGLGVLGALAANLVVILLQK